MLKKGTPLKGTLLEGIPSELPEEIFDTICSAGRVKIERIVSRGHASPEGFWYDQERCKGVKSTLDSYSAVLCDAVKKDYVQFGQQCCRENEGEDIRGSTIEKLCRGDQNRLIDESSVDLTPLLLCNADEIKLAQTLLPFLVASCGYRQLYKVGKYRRYKSAD